MAFVFKAERPDFVTNKEDLPGPGQYNADAGPEVEPNFIPFLTSEKRNINKAPPASNLPGPGSYNLPVSVKAYNPKSNKFYSDLNPRMEVLEEQQPTNVFKSSTKRQPLGQETDMPGPGTYYKETRLGQNGVKHVRKTISREKPPGVLQGSVPSIPSVIHAYGYTETGNKGLRLNKNPLLEVPKFVGPGYYEVDPHSDLAKAKGINWGRSIAQRSISLGFQTGTSEGVGPGSYKVRSKGVFPLYKLKPSAGFASKSGRGDIFSKETKKKVAKKKATNLMEENDETDDFEGAPGPGYYHNSMKASSFNQTYKPATLQFFGSGSERFGDDFSPATNMGPGKYNVGKDIAKKIERNPNMQMPFVTAVKRFDEKIEDLPGPGKYEVRTKIAEDNANIDSKKISVESFGVTQMRFKTPPNEVPGPGSYHKYAQDPKLKEEAEKLTKSSHMFVSTSKREAIKPLNANVPPPGSYDINNFDLATKVSKPDYEDPDLSPKKPPFNSGAERFRNVTAKIEEEEDDESFEEDWVPDGHTRGDLILKVRNQPKLSAAFASNSKRVGIPINEKEKNVIPGPGKYYGSQDEWNKKTYNVNFTTD